MKRSGPSPISRPRAAHPAAGFSLLELLVAMVVLLIGLMGTATMVLGGLAVSLQSKDLAVANQLAKEGMEAVFAARILGTLSYSQILNVRDGGVFLDGYQPINLIGSDGLVNTTAYSGQPALRYIDPGKNGIYETAGVPGVPYATTAAAPGGDDKIISFERFQRQILITTDSTNPNLRLVTINVQVTNKGFTSVAASLNTVVANN